MTVYGTVYYNLTNGLQCPEFEYSLIPRRYCRIQSSQLEAKAWDRVLWQAPDDMLWSLAKGRNVLVHDRSEKNRETRAMWQGLTLIEYVAHRAWNVGPWPVTGRGGKPMENLFDDIYQGLDKPLRKKYTYFRKHLAPYPAARLVSCWRAQWPEKVLPVKSTTP